ncbi:MAG: molybdenum cofactor guanylyltransferase [Spirochaetales bacterium]|nr:molybdenum cofactor guanylyltransferase [Candidatus Physcosoma equi]
MEKDVSIGILAGGRSRRFGSDKAEALLEGKSFLATLLSSFSHYRDILVSVRKDRLLSPSSFRVLRDEKDDMGPMEGLRQVLSHAENDWVFVIPVDMPLVDSSLLNALSSFMSEDYDIILPSIDSRMTPLPALYHKRVLPLVEESLEKGNLRLMDLIQRTKWKAVETASSKQLVNINDQEAYKALLATRREGK